MLITKKNCWLACFLFLALKLTAQTYEPGNVYFDKNKCKYQAQIKINGNHINLGRFNTAELAHEAYLKKKREIHPFNEL